MKIPVSLTIRHVSLRDKVGSYTRSGCDVSELREQCEKSCPLRHETAVKWRPLETNFLKQIDVPYRHVVTFRWPTL